MRPWVRYTAGWVTAAVAATGVSWAAIHDVVGGTADDVVDPPAAAVLAGRPPDPPVTPGPTGALPRPGTTTHPPVTARPSASPGPSPTGAPSRPRSPLQPVTTTTSPRNRPAVGETTASTNGEIRSYSMQGGQVVLEITATQAHIVAATPSTGFSAQSWEENGWLRVDFLSDTDRSSLFATWNGHSPSVQVYEF